MADKGANKALHDKHQRILADLLREEENKLCADCGGRGLFIQYVNLTFFSIFRRAIVGHASLRFCLLAYIRYYLSL